MDTIGYYIRTRRQELNMSQVELGEKIGKSSQVISNWERGYTKGVSVEDLKNLARALDEHTKDIIDAVIKVAKRRMK